MCVKGRKEETLIGGRELERGGQREWKEER